MEWQEPFPCECEEAQQKHREEQFKHRQQQEQEALQEQEREQRKKKERLLSKSNLPARFKLRTFENYEQNNANLEAYSRAFSYAQGFTENYKQGKGLMFIGTVGTGKTHLAAAIVLKLIEQGEPVMFGTVTSLLGQIRATYNEGSRETEQQVMRELQNCRLLVIDDLGKEKPTEWVEQTLYEIINHRYEHNKPLIITTNTNLSGIEKQYEKNGAAIVSRIAEMCKGVKCAWDDYRKYGD